MVICRRARAYEELNVGQRQDFFLNSNQIVFMSTKKLIKKHIKMQHVAI
jgi:hypothetical protein